MRSSCTKTCFRSFQPSSALLSLHHISLLYFWLGELTFCVHCMQIRKLFIGAIPECSQQFILKPHIGSIVWGDMMKDNYFLYSLCFALRVNYYSISVQESGIETKTPYKNTLQVSLAHLSIHHLHSHSFAFRKPLFLKIVLYITYPPPFSSPHIPHLFLSSSNSFRNLHTEQSIQWHHTLSSWTLTSSSSSNPSTS